MSLCGRYCRTLTLQFRHKKLEIGACVSLLMMVICMRTQHVPSNSDYIYRTLRSVNAPPQPSSCSPKQHIFFLKTHKCASTTLQTLFLRYGLTHHLNFALPAKGNLLGNPAFFTTDMIPPDLLPRDGKVDVFALHTRLNVPEHRRVLHSDTVFLTALRDPAEQFESLYRYFRLDQYYGTPIEQLIDTPKHELQNKTRKYGRFGLNMMLFDLGVNIEPHTTRAEVDMIISAMDDIFNIVLISDRLDESLILLKETLCWDFKDVVYLDKNVRKDNWRTMNMSRDLQMKLRELNDADTQLYDFFLDKHEKAVEMYGKEKMAEQVKLLQNYKQELISECGISMTQTFMVKRPTGKDKSNSYIVSETATEKCKISMLSEYDLVDKVRNQAKINLMKSNQW